MELTGLALGAVSLAGLFNAFFEIYNKIRMVKDMGEDLQQLQESLRLESARVRFVKEKYELDRLDSDSKPLLDLIMKMLNNNLEGIRESVTKYRPDTSNSNSHDNSAAASGPRKWAGIRRFRWAAGEKDDVERKMALLHSTTNTLWMLATTEAERTRQGFVLRADALSEPDQAAMVDASQFPVIAKAVKVKRLLEASLGTLPSTSAEKGTYLSSHHILARSIRWKNSGTLSLVQCSQWTMGSLNNQPVLVEWRAPFMGNGMSTPAAEKRLDLICKLLSAMHAASQDEELGRTPADEFRRTVDFAQLRCLGWTLASELTLTRIGLVFACPTSRDGASSSVLPRPLRDHIAASRRIHTPVPPLGKRFDLAYEISSAVANIISIGWTHRAIRSENMLGFGAGDDAVSKLYLVGFTYARPGDSLSEFSDLPQGQDWAFYRPPLTTDSSRDDSHIFDDDLFSPALSSDLEVSSSSVAHDMYGLGIVLVEIGHWITVHALARSMGLGSDLQAFQTEGLPKQVEKLAARCGTIYQSVVVKCLDSAHWGQESVTQNLADILQSLRLCRA